MSLCVRGNVRVAAAAREGGEHRAMRIAFRTGGVAGMFTVGLGLFGAALVVLIYKGNAPDVLEGFGFGAALLAMFMRVGGGIYTKAADVGADLVGKVEQGIPEDDPRNAATIADNVGDNVGDCAGMAADLFESYSVMLVASLILGKVAFGNYGTDLPADRPDDRRDHRGDRHLRRSGRGRGDRSGMSAINRGFFISAVISAIGVAIACFTYLPSNFSQLTGVTDSTILGLRRQPAVDRDRRGADRPRAGVSAIQLLTGYFTETNRRPVKDIGESSRTGAATVILSGISSGMESAVYSALLIGAAVYGAFLLGTGNADARAVRGGPGRDRPADHGRRDRVDGLLRPGDRQRAGHRRDVRRRRGRGRAGADPPGRDRQHDQGDHQGHRDRDRGAGGDGAVRLVPHAGRAARSAARPARSACPSTSRTCWSA